MHNKWKKSRKKGKDIKIVVFVGFLISKKQKTKKPFDPAKSLEQKAERHVVAYDRGGKICEVNTEYFLLSSS